MPFINGHACLLPGSMWGIAVYFNPVHYKNKLENFLAFRWAARKQGLQLLIVELAFGDAAYVIDDENADRVLRFRARDILWQKERLLNIALQHLPSNCDKVVWLDGDILFERDDWIAETCSLLEHARVVQPFQIAHWLSKQAAGEALSVPQICGKDIRSRDLVGEQALEGAAYSFCKKDDSCTLAGHTGFAWAARREVFDKCGFYDRLILGSGDTIMACGLFGLVDCSGFETYLSSFVTQSQAIDILEWTRVISNHVGRSIGYIPGSVFHLWHGEFANRKYIDRLKILEEENFHPKGDLVTDSHGVWRWCSSKSKLHKRVRHYFEDRQEDVHLLK